MSARVKGVATHDPTRTKIAALEQAVFLDCLKSVLGTGRSESTSRWNPYRCLLVKADQEDSNSSAHLLFVCLTSSLNSVRISEVGVSTAFFEIEKIQSSRKSICGSISRTAA